MFCVFPLVLQQNMDNESNSGELLEPVENIHDFDPQSQELIDLNEIHVIEADVVNFSPDPRQNRGILKQKNPRPILRRPGQERSHQHRNLEFKPTPTIEKCLYVKRM